VASSRSGRPRLDSIPSLIFSSEVESSSFSTEPSQGKIPIGPSSSWQKRTFRIDVSQLDLLNDKRISITSKSAQEANRKQVQGSTVIVEGRVKVSLLLVVERAQAIVCCSSDRGFLPIYLFLNWKSFLTWLPISVYICPITKWFL
jgi:hypothetical protein